MACDGTRIFVLGGLLSPGAQADETNPIHILDTSMYFFLSFYLDPILNIQSTSISRNPTPTSILVKRPPTSCGSRQ
jgi:hypothetical protein